MSVLQNKIVVKKETVSIKQCEITIQKVLNMVCQAMCRNLDNVWIADEEPSISSDNFDDDIKVILDKGKEIDMEGLIEDIQMLFEEDLEKYIEEMSGPREEGENGVL